MTFVEEMIAAGYDVGVASGSVKTEEDALAAARDLAAPTQIEADVQTIADQAAADAAAVAVARGIPAEKIPDAVSEAVARITKAALEAITVARNEQVAFHERALQIATVAPTTYVVSGPGFTNLYVEVDDATGEPVEAQAEAWARIRDPEQIRETWEYQARLADHPDGDAIAASVSMLRGCGCEVKPTIAEGGTGFTVEIVEGGKPAAVISDDLEALSAKVAEVEAAAAAATSLFDGPAP